MNWNPFSRKDKTSSEVDEKLDSTHTTAGKGRPTPKRRDAEKARLTPIAPKDRKAQRKAANARRRERENSEYEAMRTGDLRNMPKAEQLPWRIYIRDYVDARYNLGEYFMIVIVVLLFAALGATYVFPQASLVILILMYVYLFAIIIDTWIMWRSLKKKLIDKFGERAVARGMRSGYYAWSRALQIRAWRLPKPRYKKHGNYPK
ncbi:DUF3043 domain-containing protein [Alloscardovia theropitheci]|uniref:DUF3043 domain-containing protein n=1 Tax=Alloscardovia theropitheci TaxID=2496842 RepID=A0A4V2MTS0_9BIFI|nr:DUF3043 domain-containing protein [Alloscardovia theropitheci]TCD53589.1 DUF3043 domain-containing protein [Alloscardovia theropitheci]